MPRRWSTGPAPDGGGWFNLYRGDQFIGTIRAAGDADQIVTTLNNAATVLTAGHDTVERAVRTSHTDNLLAATSDNEWDVADVMAALQPFLREDT